MRESSSDTLQTARFVRDNIVKIVNIDGTKFYGTGFCLFENQQKFIISCHHCIYKLDQIFIEKDGKRYSCKWIEEYSDMNNDLAVLKCDDEDIPVQPLNHNPKALPKLDVVVWGFSTGGLENFQGGTSVENLKLASDYNRFRWPAEEINGNNKWNNKPEVNLNVYQIQGLFEQGFSGAPVCYTWDNNVIGIFTAKTDNNGYVIPIQTLLQKINKNSEILAAETSINTKEYLEKGNLFYDKRKFEEAIIQYDKIIKDVNYLSALSNKGNALSDLGKYDKAIECYDKVLEVDPNDVRAYYNKGNALSYLGKYDKAIECYDKALELDPNYVNVLVNKGNALCNQFTYEDAIECYDKALEVDPNSTSAYNNKKVARAALEHLSY